MVFLHNSAGAEINDMKVIKKKHSSDETDTHMVCSAPFILFCFFYFFPRYSLLISRNHVILRFVPKNRHYRHALPFLNKNNILVVDINLVKQEFCSCQDDIKKTNKTIISHALVKSALVIYHLISNVHSWTTVT